MTRSVVAALVLSVGLASCQGTSARSTDPQSRGTGPSAAPSHDAVPIDVQGRFDGVLTPAQAKATRAPTMPPGGLVLKVDPNGSVGVLDYANKTAYLSGMHEHGPHTVVATTTPAPLPSAGQLGPQAPMGCSGPGTYRWTYDPNHFVLRFSVVSDTCVDRALLLAGVRWRLHGMAGR